jgi:hypothetical protein
MARKKSKLGRPPRHAGEILSKNRTFRCRGKLDEMLEEEAARTGRSVSESIERMLEDAFFQRRLNANILGSGVADEILRLIRVAMVVEGIAGDWSGDPVKAENLRVAVNAIVAALTRLPLELPPPERRTEGMRTARELLLHSSKKRELPPEIMFSNLEDLDFGQASARTRASSGGGEG